MEEALDTWRRTDGRENLLPDSISIQERERGLMAKQRRREKKNKTYLHLRVKRPIFLTDFNKIWNFSTDFSLKFQIPNFMEIRLVEAAVIIADRWTNMANLTCDFRPPIRTRY